MALRINISNYSIKIDENIFSFSRCPQYIYLYAYLAYEKKTKSLGNDGFSYPLDIQKLPMWDKKRVESIGKEIRRHIEKMEKKKVNVIESQQKIKGPFRLAVSSKQISFDKDIQYVREFLCLDVINPILNKKESAEELYKYTEAVCQGFMSFNQGALKNAFNHYKAAFDTPLPLIEYKVILLLKMARIHERQGDYKEAMVKLNKALTLLKKETATNYLMKAKIIFYLGWIYYRRRIFSKAQKCFYESLDLLRGKRHYMELGEIYNGLGLLHEINHYYRDALSYHFLSLSYWSNTDYLYGIQSAYFNIGNIYYKREKYNDAKWWIEKCIILCDTARIGQETSQAEILMVEIYLHYNDLEKARKYAIKAKRMALKGRNALDLTTSNKLFGILHFKREKYSRSKFYFKISKSKFKKWRRKKIVNEIDSYLSGIDIKVKELNSKI